MLKRHVLLWATAVAMILSGQLSAFAQAPAIVNGQVTVANSKEPVEGAVIRMFIEGSEKSLSMKSDKKGNFMKVGVKPGSYKGAIVECAGYHPLTVKGIELKNNEKFRIVLPLVPL